jgi:hypothetical protein
MCQNCPAAYADRPAGIVDELVPCIMVGDWQRRRGRSGRLEERVTMNSKGVASAGAPAFFVGRICSGRCS